MKVLFIDSTHESLPSLFRANNWEVMDGSTLSKEDLISILPKFEGIIIRSRFVLDHEFLKHAVNLKFIGRPGAGIENIDTDFCKKNNIDVFRSPEGNRDAVAEHTVGLLLMLFNKLNLAHQQVQNGVWDRLANRGEELMGKTVGIIGYGFMGEAVAKRLKGFNCNVIAYDKYKTGFSNNIVTEVELNELFEKTDVLSLHTPLTQETIGFVNTEFLNQFKNSIYLVNTARGQSVILKDLVEELKTGKVKGACLDVLEIEKTTFEQVSTDEKSDDLTYLLSQENVIITPHIAGWTHQSNEKMARILGEKILDFYQSI